MAHLRQYPHPIFQRIRRLRHYTRTNGWTGWKSGKSAWIANTGVQCQLCIFPALHGCVRFHSYSVRRTDQLTRVCVGLVCFVFLICSLRTNIVFFLIFLSLICAFGCLAGAYWNLALAYENAANTMAAKRAGRLVVVSSLHYTYKASATGLILACLLGRWCLHIHHVHVWLVDLLRHHACIPRFPIQYPSW